MIDRAYHIPKARMAPETGPRDVLASIHFYETKERLLGEMHNKKNNLPAPYDKILILPDLSQSTLQAQWKCMHINTTETNIKYKPYFPKKVLLTPIEHSNTVM